MTYRTNKIDKTFKDAKEAENFFKTLASVIVDALLAEHSKLEKEVRTLITSEAINENFSTTPPIA